MQVGVISDVHGNSTALKRVLDDMPEVDVLVSLGDVVGYGPHPRECVELIQEHTAVSLYGNHESYLGEAEHIRGNPGAYHGIKHAEEQLTDEQFEWAKNRPMRDLIDHNLGICHGHPDPETPFAYVRKSNVTELIPILRKADWNLLAAGHSHVQFKQDLRKFHPESGVVFNPGSVGQPRDKDPRSGYAVVDTETLEINLHRVEYDVQAVVEEIDDAGLPEVNGARLVHGKVPSKYRW